MSRMTCKENSSFFYTTSVTSQKVLHVVGDV